MVVVGRRKVDVRQVDGAGALINNWGGQAAGAAGGGGADPMTKWGREHTLAVPGLARL
jgi:hypothetical protein